MTCFSFGSVHRLSNGHTLTNFSIQGKLDEVDEEGELVWQLDMPLGGALGYSEWHQSLIPKD